MPTIPKYGRYEGFITILSYAILFYSAKNYLIITCDMCHIILNGRLLLKPQYNQDSLQVCRNLKDLNKCITSGTYRLVS